MASFGYMKSPRARVCESSVPGGWMIELNRMWLDDSLGRKINQALGEILNAFSVDWQAPLPRACRWVADGWQAKPIISHLSTACFSNPARRYRLNLGFA